MSFGAWSLGEVREKEQPNAGPRAAASVPRWRSALASA